MKRLLNIGFRRVGRVLLKSKSLSIQLSEYAERNHVLYAFAIGDEIKYVGKSVRPLSKRLYGYEKPSHSQKTNARVNKELIEAINNGADVSIYAYADDGKLSRGGFHLNTADGLENSIIDTFNPEWNITGKAPRTMHKIVSDTPHSTETVRTNQAIEKRAFSGKPIFKITLGKAYWEQGFFNVGVDFEKYFAGDQSPINIFLGENNQAITGHINRSANTNNTPRIMGGAAMRDWIQRNTKFKGEITIEVLSPHDIRLHKSR